MNIIEGTARNMGISISGRNDKELAEQTKEAAIEEKEMAKREAQLEAMEEEAKSDISVDVPVIGDEDKENEE